MRPLHKDDPRQIGGHRLVAVLGEGATAQVFLAATPEGHPIVLKAVRPIPARDPAFRTRFAHDVASAERVASPYTVPVLDACTDGPVLWLATAYTPGPGVGEAVAKYGPLPPRSVRTLASGLASALEALHGVGLVHGRLGPTQVSLAPDGPRLVDLGVARSPDGPSVADAGVVIGTVLPSPGFRAPEQLDGRLVGAPADVFSLGCVIVHAATGNGPFGADTSPGVTERVLYGIPELRVLPSWLRELAAACLAKEPADRPTPAQVHAATASELDGPGWLPHDIAAEVAQRAATVWAHSGAATPGTGATTVPRTAPAAPVRTPEPAGAGVVPPQQAGRPVARPPFRDAPVQPVPVGMAHGAAGARTAGSVAVDGDVAADGSASHGSNRDLPPVPQPKMLGGPGAARHVQNTPGVAAAPADSGTPAATPVGGGEAPGTPEPPAAQRRFPAPVPRGPGASTRIGASRGRRTTRQQPAPQPRNEADAVVGGPGAAVVTGAAQSDVPPRPDAVREQPSETANTPSANRVSDPAPVESDVAAATPQRQVGGPGAAPFARNTAPDEAQPSASEAAAEPEVPAGATATASDTNATTTANPGTDAPPPVVRQPNSPEPAATSRPSAASDPPPRTGPVITVETIGDGATDEAVEGEIIEAEIVEAELVDDDEPLPPRASASAPPGVTDLPGKPAGAVRRDRNGRHDRPQDRQHDRPRERQRDGRRGEPHDVPREGPRGPRRPSTDRPDRHERPGRPTRPGDDQDRARGRGRKDERGHEQGHERDHDRNHARPTAPNGSRRPPADDASRPDASGPNHTPKAAKSPTTASTNPEAAQQRSAAHAERRRFLAWVAGGAAVLAGAATGAVLLGDGGGGKKPVRTMPVAAPPAAAPVAPPPAALRVWFRQGSLTADQLPQLDEALRGADGRLRLAAELKEPTGYAQVLVTHLAAGPSVAPDVFEVDILSLANHLAAGRIADLTPYQDRFDTDSWLPAIRGAVKVGDKSVALPLTASAPVVLYHQGLFAEAGVAVPRTREEWVDGLGELRTHFAGNPAFRPLWLPGRSWHVLASMMWGSGGALALREGDSWRGAFDLPGSIDGVRFFRQMQQYAPEAQDLAEDGARVGELFARKQTASAIGAASLHPAALKADAGLAQQLNAFPMPGRTADAPGSVGVQGTALVVSSTCRDVPAAVELLALLATDPWRTRVAQAAGCLSPREVPEQAVTGPNPMLRAGAAAARASGHAYPAAPGWSERPVVEFGRAVLAGTDAMAAAASANQAVAAEFGRTTG
ncbi:protein kinase domain-containing protein [Yinghuangia sp. YIM S09857]|uniref:protein kinase domain-containing protein n=1 Tax=Yinghuangia sp. YIM S09857 TaxID=3436929 RepID=UPI003F5352EA